MRFLDRSGSPPGAGALFGLAIAPAGRGIYFVDDATNKLDLLHLAKLCRAPGGRTAERNSQGS